MELEERGPARLGTPLLVTLLLAASLAIPGYLWVTRGRELPLGVVLDPPRYVVSPGERLPLRMQLTPPSRDEVQLTWEGSGLDGETWVAPAKPGSYTVKVVARRSGTKVRDSVTFQVTAAGPGPTLERPAQGPERPQGLEPCKGPGPKIQIHGELCTGATAVVQVKDSSGQAWHWLEGSSRVRRGPWAELVVPEAGRLISLLVPSGRSCAWTLQRPLGGGACRAGPRAGAVFADFSWELVSPGHVRLAAKPSRTPGLRFERFRWDFGDGTRKETRGPQVAHRFKAPLKRWNLVSLEVVAGDKTARGRRLVVDRTVQ